jgi:glycosyltransferase involved in cell wall biosynthesis
LPGYPPLDWAMDIMQNYERFIFVSETVRREWQAIPEIAARNGCVIPNCCREEQIAVVWAQSREELRKRLGFRAETFVIVCVASVQYLKGQDLLVQAFNALQAADKQQTKNSVLVLVGQPSSVVGTDWGETFVQSVAASPQADRIKLMGARVDALDFLRAADVMVLPSRSEVMPVTILEAMALGTPVVASSVGGIPELIEHDRTGLLAAPNSVEELTEALTAMQANPEQRQRFTLAAQEKYRTQFSQYCLTTRYAEVLKQFLCGEEWA